jgi:hypothetical protein
VITEVADTQEDRWVSLPALASLEPVMSLLTDTDAERCARFATITRASTYFSYCLGPAGLLTRRPADPLCALQRNATTQWGAPQRLSFSSAFLASCSLVI